LAQAILAQAFFAVCQSSTPLLLSSAKMGIFGKSKKADDKPVTAPEQKIINDDKTAEGGVDAGTKGAEPLPDSFVITLEKAAPENTLGATLVYPGNKQLTVKALKEEGLIVEWNKNNGSKPELKLYANDLIINVNGVKDDAAAMLDQLKKVGPITMTVVHGKDYTPAPEPEKVETPAAAQPVEAPAESAEPAEEPAAEPSVQPEVQQKEETQGAVNDDTEIAAVVNDPGEMKGEEQTKYCGCFLPGGAGTM